ncbi:hypothetical protein [Flavobacterium sp.]|jgi:hypothetical protein|uniref:hypothetical protein n=1 Tax=Flavobacterium sp. TaxID=239 RepID=UPI002625E849|nr:hypothetical protein [Flavobacterium sp.]
MGQKEKVSNKEHLLSYDEIIAIAPNLSQQLNEESAFEFSKQLYEFTNLIFEQYQDEKEKSNIK